jgi:hypothetical protein
MKSSDYRRASYGSSLKVEPKAAFATLVMLDDGYIPGALLLGYSLRKKYPECLLICMVTKEVTASARDLLGAFFNHVIEVDKIFVPCRGMKMAHYLPYVFTKLNALLLCSGGLLSFDPESVIFLDADVLPLKNYHDLVGLKAPAGIINEYKSNLIKNDSSNRYLISAKYKSRGKWHWHNIYDPVCPHGELIPSYITDRVRDIPKNMGIHGALLVLKPSLDEFDSIMKDIDRPVTKNRIRQYRWPEMQYLTLRWSGSWRNIDIKYCGFKGYPSIDMLYGTHFAGVKPWRLAASRRDLFNPPDRRLWHATYLRMYAEYRLEFSHYVKFKRLAKTISSITAGSAGCDKNHMPVSAANNLPGM